MSGKLHLSGDMGLFMKLGTLLIPRSPRDQPATEVE
jgi:hypothetical protein